MNCDFCYIPFDFKSVGTLEQWLKILDYCKELSVNVITFGGGDPFLQRDFPQLLENLDKGDLFLQIDTNGLHLKDEHLCLIAKSIDLVGLPLDGIREVHTEMRKHDMHFDVVINWINKLNDAGVKVKINTVVTKKNIQHLDNLARFLSDLPVSAWSLYQFWPIGPCKKYRQQFEVSTEDFCKTISFIKEKYTFTNIEASTIDNRNFSYFFVTSLGCVYAIDRHDIEKYTKIGNIFDDDIIDKWELHGNNKCVKSRAQQRINMVK